MKKVLLFLIGLLVSSSSLAATRTILELPPYPVTPNGNERLWMELPGYQGCAGLPDCSVSLNQVRQFVLSNVSGSALLAISLPTNYAGGIATWPVSASGLAPDAAAGNLGYTPLNPARNLSDLSDSTAGRYNLGIVSFTVNQSVNSSISPTNLRSGSGALAAGLYRITYYLTITNVATGSVQVTFGWSDPTQPRVSTSVPTNTSATNAFSDSLVVKSNGVADITYSTTLVGSASYSIDINVAKVF